MRIYKTRKDFTALNAAGNPGVFKGTVCTITDEAANPMYTFQNNTWTGVVTETTDPITGEITLSSNGVKFSVWDIRSFGAKCDGKVLFTSNVGNGSSILNDPSAAFTQDDVGKPCVLTTNSAGRSTPRRGTITAVNSSTQIVLSFTAAISYTNALFVYGTDDGTSINAAITSCAASGGGAVDFPQKIACSKLQHTLPNGVWFRGTGNNPKVMSSNTNHYAGSVLVGLEFYGSGALVTCGDSVVSSNGKASGIFGMTIDCMDIHSYAVTSGCTGMNLLNVTAIGGTVAAVVSGASGVITNCSCVGTQRQNAVQMSGDSRLVNSYAYQSGTGYAAVQVNNGDDVQIIGNHFYKGGTNTTLGPSIEVKATDGTLTKGSILIEGNSFDTAFGPHILLTMSGTSTLRGLLINGNHFFQNDSVPNATYPVIQLSIAAGSILRGLVVNGNIVRGSWNDPTKGQPTAFIDGASIAGNVYGSSVVGNIADNTPAGYATFTPTYSAGNLFISGVGTVVTAF